MRLSEIAEATVSRLIGRLARRAGLMALVGVLAIVAVYYASSAATIALAMQLGPLNAYLIMAGIYTVAALIVITVLYTTRTRELPVQDQAANALASPRNMQIAMLVEAVMLGYSLARKSSGKGVI